MNADPYLTQPREVSIETLALCNARCTFCPYETLERKGTRMDSALIDRLIREMSSFKAPFFVSPFKVNEPLLDDRLADICQAIEDDCPTARLRLFTNGQPLTAKHLEWIGKLKKLDHLWISLNECDSQKYGEIMKLSFSITFARLHALHEQLLKGIFRQTVVVSRVSDGNGLHWSANDLEFRKWVSRTWPLFTVRLIKRDGWLGYVEPTTTEVPIAPCARWFELNLCADGTAALCCMDGKGEYSIGKIQESTLLDLYNQSYLVARRQHARDRRGIEPCQRCTY